MKLYGEDTVYGASPDSGNDDKPSNRFGDLDGRHIVACLGQYYGHIASTHTNPTNAGLVAEGCCHDGQLQSYTI